MHLVHSTLCGIISFWTPVFKMTRTEPRFYDSALFSLVWWPRHSQTDKPEQCCPQRIQLAAHFPRLNLHRAAVCKVLGRGWGMGERRLESGISWWQDSLVLWLPWHFPPKTCAPETSVSTPISWVVSSVIPPYSLYWGVPIVLLV